MTSISKHSDAEMNDEDIDFSDIPEATPEMLKNARLRVPKRSIVETPLSDRLLSDASYIALGRILSSFNCLEHELMRAVIVLRGGLDAIQPDTDTDTDTDAERQIETEISDSLGRRLNTFIDTYRSERGDDDWIADFESKLTEVCEYRNHFYHGLWREKEKGWLHCTFYKRENKGQKPREMIWTAKLGVLLEIAEANFRNAELLAEHIISVADMAAE